MSVQARYAGDCGECGGRWQPGDLICSEDSHLPLEKRRKPTVWRHVVCPDNTDDPTTLRRGETVCQACWLTTCDCPKEDQ